MSLAGVPASTPILGQVNFKANADAGGDFPQNTYRLLGRLDLNPTDKTQMFVRVGKENQDLFAGSAFYSPYPQYDVGSSVDNLSTLLSISHFQSGSLQRDQTQLQPSEYDQQL